MWGEAVRLPHAVGTLPGLWHAPPAPLAVLNHGSSDGVDPRAAITMECEARWLRDQGYAVLVPMRPGRGASDGVYGEASCCDLVTGAPRDCSAGLAQAVEDLRTAIDFGLRQSGVRPGPVLLMGQSRGGFLSPGRGVRPDEPVEAAATRSHSASLRWSPLAGQFGDDVKLGSDCRQAANLSNRSSPYASSGVPPARAEWGRRAL